MAILNELKLVFGVAWLLAMIALCPRALCLLFLALALANAGCTVALPPASAFQSADASADGGDVSGALSGVSQHCGPCEGDNECAIGLYCDSTARICKANVKQAYQCPADCGEMCTTHGKCDVIGTSCVVTTAGCAASTDCKQHGWCWPVQGKCAPTSQADCAGSLDCKQHGFCTWDGKTACL